MNSAFASAYLSFFVLVLALGETTSDLQYTRENFGSLDVEFGSWNGWDDSF